MADTYPEYYTENYAEESDVATVATQNPGTTGAVPTMSAASGGGDKVAPGVRLLVLNGGSGSINLTIAVPSTNDVDGLAVPDRVIAIANGSFPTGAKLIDIPAYYQDPADGLVALSWSGTTSVTFAALGTQRS